MKAHKCFLKVKGQVVFNVPVRIEQSGLFWERHTIVHVLARTPTEACNAVRDEIAPYVSEPTELTAYGPQGGKTHRWIGYESMIFARLCNTRDNTNQLNLIP